MMRAKIAPGLKSYVQSHLFSLGSRKLAALWESDDTCDLPYCVRVYCTIIKMSQEADCDSQVNFVACPLSCPNYYVQGSMIMDCLAVWGDKGEYMTNPQHLVDMLSCQQPRTLLLVFTCVCSFPALVIFLLVVVCYSQDFEMSLMRIMNA